MQASLKASLRVCHTIKQSEREGGQEDRTRAESVAACLANYGWGHGGGGGRTGCAWQVRAMSSEEAPYSMPSTPSAIISPALGPMMWMPRMRSVALSVRIFTMPSASPTARARLEITDNMNNQAICTCEDRRGMAACPSSSPRQPLWP